MERESLKEYSEASTVEKEERYAMKSCFEELCTFLSMGAIFFRSLTEPNKRKADLSVKKIHFSMGIYVDINL